MNTINFKATLGLLLTVAFLILAFTTEQLLDSRLYAVIALCLGLYVAHLLANKRHLSE